MTTSTILIPGRNCWRLAAANRIAFLIDGAAYFAAVRAAMREARESILILGWDVDSRVRLGEPDDADGLPAELGEFLNALVVRRRGLHAYVLTWDFHSLFAFEREWFPRYKLGWRTDRHVHFRLDGVHPPGASHHQKVVVIDDVLAFLGGFDLTRCRWDTPAHEPNDPRRCDPDGAPYAPFHDVQGMVAGDAAALLGELARERWRRAGGRAIPPATPRLDFPWPADVPPDCENVPVALARTIPGRNGGKVREVERLHLDLIQTARESIYIENQYLTSEIVCKALAERLREPNGPEIVIVSPQETSGWLEQRTMGVLRSQCAARLRQADRHGRLRLYYPWQPGLGQACINLHAKVLVVDDRLVRVGSSNLSNRSMRLDTECDMAIDASDDVSVQAAIARFRSRLLAEHLGVTVAAIDGALRATSSLDWCHRIAAGAGSILTRVGRLHGSGQRLATRPGRDCGPRAAGERRSVSGPVHLPRPMAARATWRDPLRRPPPRGLGGGGHLALVGPRRVGNAARGRRHHDAPPGEPTRPGPGHRRLPGGGSHPCTRHLHDRGDGHRLRPVGRGCVLGGRLPLECRPHVRHWARGRPGDGPAARRASTSNG